jgi:hypothetical protein
MDTAPDIRAHIHADAHLQTEINHALLAVADGLPAGSDRRVVRILTRTLEPSWTEHVSFQDAVVFPIVEARHGQQVKAPIDRLRADHAGLTQRHSEIGELLDQMLHHLHGGAAPLDGLLSVTLQLRQAHFELDAALDTWLPATFTKAERALCSDWAAARPEPRFPLNLLRTSGRPYPRLVGRLH